MEELPKTKRELIEQMDVDNVEYVHDIGLDEKYGMSLSGSVDFEGREVRVLGSVVLDDDGNPVIGKGTSFVAYPDGMTNEAVTLVEGEEAVNAASYIFGEFGVVPFKESENADIADDAW